MAIQRMQGYAYVYGNFNFSDYVGGTAFNTTTWALPWQGGSTSSVGYPNVYPSYSIAGALSAGAGIGTNIHSQNGFYVYKPIGWQDVDTTSYTSSFFSAYLNEVLLPFLIPSIAESTYGVNINTAIPDMVILETEMSILSSQDSDWITICDGIRSAGYTGLIALEYAGGYALPSWVNLVDVIAGDFYLEGSDPGTLAGYESIWQNQVVTLLNTWNSESGKFTYLSEIGWYLSSITETNIQLFIEAMFNVLGPITHYLGFSWWSGYQAPPTNGTDLLTSDGTAPFGPSPTTFKTWGANYLYLENTPASDEGNYDVGEYDLASYDNVTGTASLTLVGSAHTSNIGLGQLSIFASLTGFITNEFIDNGSSTVLRRNFTNCQPTELLLAVNTSTNSFTVASLVGFPAVPYTITIDRGLSTQEVCLVTEVSNDVLQVTRNYDYNGSYPHQINAVVEMSMVANDFYEANQHATNSALDEHIQYYRNDGTRHDGFGNHLVGTQLEAGIPSNSSIGDTALAGLGPLVVRADHVHGRESLDYLFSVGSMFFCPLLTNNEVANFVFPPGIWLNCNGSIYLDTLHPQLASFLGEEYDTNLPTGYFMIPNAPQFYIKADN